MFGSIGSTSKSPIHEVAPKANIMNVAGTIFFMYFFHILHNFCELEIQVKTNNK